MVLTSARADLEFARMSIEQGVRARSEVRVTGSSMRPALLPGMRVIVETTDPNHLKVGDLICYYREGFGWQERVVHRVVRFELGPDGNRLVVTRGDANGKDDPPVPVADVFGKVTAIRRARVTHHLRGMLRPLLRPIAKMCSVLVAPLTRRVIGDAARIFVKRDNERGLVSASAILWSVHAARGVLILRPRWGQSIWEISSLRTRPVFRNMGIARRLCEALLKEIRETRGARVVLQVLPGNLAALRLYCRMGFTRIRDTALAGHIGSRSPVASDRIVLEYLPGAT